MRILIQRVSEASVVANGTLTGSINSGLCILLGIETNDTQEDVDWLCQKISALRIFNDSEGKMNLSVQDTSGEILIVSQFTLHASTKKGNRPSFINAAHPDFAIPLYNSFINKLEELMPGKIQKGIFGADMKVHLLNDGPVTIWIDSKSKE